MLNALHGALSTALLLLTLICLGWSALGIVSGRGVAPGLRSTLLMTLGAAVAQLVLGVLLVAVAGRPFSGLHTLYGLALIVSLGGAAVYGGRAGQGREALIYALVTLFSAGLVLRAMETVGRLG